MATRAGSLRAEIALSWRRVAMRGLRPDMPVDRLTVAEIDNSSRLLVAARPVLEEIAAALAGTDFCTLLADRDCRIVHRWFDTAAVERMLDGISAVPGSQFAEDSIGTNGLGTAIEVRRGVVVHGPEHFNERLKRFSCYGHPIRHPLTHRIEGVLDITGVTKDANPMLGPYLARAVADIEHRLLDGARISEKRLLEAFQTAARRARPVAALAGDTVLTNRAAIDLLDAADHATLRAVAADPGVCGCARRITLASGTLVEVQVERVPGTDGGAVLALDPVDKARVPIPRGAVPARDSGVDRRLRALGGVRGAALIAGEPGTGRTTGLSRVADDVAVLDATDAAAMGTSAWAARATELAGIEGPLAVEQVQLLPEALCGLVAKLIDQRHGKQTLLTSTPADQLPPPAVNLAARCGARVDIPPLRHRLDELPSLVGGMLADIRPGCQLRLTPSALEALAAQPWLANLKELAGVLRYVAERRSAGDVTPLDLPPTYRSAAKAARLAGRDRAERAAIIEALRASRGNKVRAAERLGISRTTLYSRMRALDVAR